MKLKNYVITGLVSVLVLFSSCGDTIEGDTVYQGGNANLENHSKKVPKGDWKWYEDTQRYEVGYELPAIDGYTVDEEAVIAYLIAYEGDVKVVKTLPFEEEYTIELEDGSPYVFTRRIAYDYSKSNITFYIENSDRDEDKRPWEDLEFKIVIIKNLDL